MRDQVAGVDNARTLGIDHSDKFISHFASVLVYCHLSPGESPDDITTNSRLQSTVSRSVVTCGCMIPTHW